MAKKKLEYNAALVEREDLTPTLTIFYVAPDEGIPADQNWFVPGQYMAIGLNNEEQPELGPVQRPMSIASAPERGDAVEFYIRYVEQPTSKNPLTHLLWKCAVGDRLSVRMRPKGKFTIPDTVGNDDPRLKVFVSAGTGLAPFASIVRSHHNRNPQARLEQFGILHGASYPPELGYRSELEGHARDRGLHYLSSVSRPREAPDWAGNCGRVEDFFLPERLESTEQQLGLAPGELHAGNAVVYICGLQGTIGNTILRLVARGFVPEERRLRQLLEVSADVPANLFWEQYDTEPVIDLNDEELMSRARQDLQNALKEIR